MHESPELDFPELTPEFRAQIEAELRQPVTAPRFLGISILHAMGYAPWPVWRGSSKTPTKWVPIQKTDALKWFKLFERWAARAALPGRGRAARAVLRSLLFRFLNWRTGQLDPAYETIAEDADYGRSTVAVALQQLRTLGVIAWCRRCHEGVGKDGRFLLQQESNAYFILPPSQWHGFTEEAQPPPPAPETWGATPPLSEQAEVSPEPVELTPAQQAAAAARLAQAEADLAIFRAAKARRAGRAPPD